LGEGWGEGALASPVLCMNFIEPLGLFTCYFNSKVLR
jgi:hypothetical protein